MTRKKNVEIMYRWLAQKECDNTEAIKDVMARNTTLIAIAEEVGFSTHVQARNQWHEFVKENLGWEYDTETRRYIVPSAQ